MHKPFFPSESLPEAEHRDQEVATALEARQTNLRIKGYYPTKTTLTRSSQKELGPNQSFICHGPFTENGEQKKDDRHTKQDVNIGSILASCYGNLRFQWKIWLSCVAPILKNRPLNPN